MTGGSTDKPSLHLLNAHSINKNGQILAEDPQDRSLDYQFPPVDREQFKILLVKWIASSNQPLLEVKNPDFRNSFFPPALSLNLPFFRTRVVCHLITFTFFPARCLYFLFVSQCMQSETGAFLLLVSGVRVCAIFKVNAVYIHKIRSPRRPVKKPAAAVRWLQPKWPSPAAKAAIRSPAQPRRPAGY
jgi:hypothetical protein